MNMEKVVVVFYNSSCIVFRRLSGQDDKQTFESQLQQVFFSINSMMKDLNDAHLDVQVGGGRGDG